MKSRNSLKNHKKFHQGLKYQCDFVIPETGQVCARRFVTSTLLKDHLEKLHRGIKKYPCQQCSMGFNGKTDLRYHVINVCISPHFFPELFIGF
jgi:hypothetical protein